MQAEALAVMEQELADWMVEMKYLEAMDEVEIFMCILHVGTICA
jgi:hypothetical protein